MYGMLVSEDYLINYKIMVIDRVINVLIKKEDILIVYFFLL